MFASVTTNQPRITSFFPILNQLTQLILETKVLQEKLNYFLESNSDKSIKNKNFFSSDQNLTPFLKKLFENACLNSNKANSAKRYENSLKLFSTYLFTIGGRLLYETLCKNLALPSLSTVSRTMSKYSCFLTEGKIRAKELKQFLDSRKLPLTVWLSEDATRITGRIQYDPPSNQLVGFVLPLGSDGMPLSNTFSATTLEKIQNTFQNATIAKLLYVIIAQSLVDKGPSFCLCLYGTDNKFTFEDVLNRWKYMFKCLEDESISVLGMSADGDSRLLKAMQLRSKLQSSETPPDQSPISCFRTEFESLIAMIQDIIHFIANLRSRLLKPSITLPMGDQLVSANHLRHVLENVSKDKHCLNAKDLSLKDKMNYVSCEKICSENIRKILEEEVPGSKATVLYLKIMYLFSNAFLSKTLEPLKRVQDAWYCILVLRYWRAWLSSSNYSITDNFITLNAYVCMELNAHSLVNVMIKLKNAGQTELFLPWLFSSQSCEEFFRYLRYVYYAVNRSKLQFIRQYAQDSKDTASK